MVWQVGLETASKAPIPAHITSDDFDKRERYSRPFVHQLKILPMNERKSRISSKSRVGIRNLRQNISYNLDHTIHE